MATEKGLHIHDHFMLQLEELMKCRHVGSNLQKLALEELAKSYLGDCDPMEYGVWVFYPWSRRLVHLLDEPEFVEVRTNRNQLKITLEEQLLLRSKIVGIVGLSVGQSVALTMAMERVCGELRLADFDTAELSNLNRIRTGVHNIGLKKTVIAAREISEIDPFLKVTLFNEGLTSDNMTDFLSGSKPLDALIEVCDSLNIKLECRYAARKLGIPVIMDTNDRGMLDVERFDLDPDRALFHGLVPELLPTEVAMLPPAERMKFILRIAGGDQLSQRMKWSMSEIGKSINTWPQLASSVVLGGAVTTDVTRRVLLDHFTQSGRFYVDLDAIIGD